MLFRFYYYGCTFPWVFEFYFIPFWIILFIFPVFVWRYIITFFPSFDVCFRKVCDAGIRWWINKLSSLIVFRSKYGTLEWKLGRNIFIRILFLDMEWSFDVGGVCSFFVCYKRSHRFKCQFKIELNINAQTWELINVFFLGTTNEAEPEFSEAIPNITIPVGRDIQLPCIVDNLGSYRVSFTLMIYFMHL